MRDTDAAGEAKVWRAVDANANRASEGLRTLEDCARFLFEDERASMALKNLRHLLAAALQRLDRAQLLAHRSTATDPGTAITSATERSRHASIELVQAEVARIGQALRSLEEFTKLIDDEVSQKLKQLRYTAYDELAAIELRWTAHAWLPSVRMCILIDCQRELGDFINYLRVLADAGANCFQIRDKQRDGRQLVDYACRAVELLRPYNAHVVVNDRVDVALASGAAGVHVGQDDLSIEEVRRIAGHRLVVGVSTHDIHQARQALQRGADYIGCGPSFPSQTKSFEHFRA